MHSISPKKLRKQFEAIFILYSTPFLLFVSIHLKNLGSLIIIDGVLILTAEMVRIFSLNFKTLQSKNQSLILFLTKRSEGYTQVNFHLKFLLYTSKERLFSASILIF